MGLIDRLFGKASKTSILDPVFGVLTYEKGIWTHLPAREDEGWMITIDAPESGPSDEQREFFQEVSQSMAALVQRAKDFVTLESSNEIAARDLQVYSLEIGTDADTRTKRFIIELADDEAIVIHRVSFDSGVPTHYTHDD